MKGVGKYTANLLLIFDNGQRDVPLESTITFWVFPWKAIIAIVLFILVAFLVLKWIIKRYINREIQKRLKTS